MANFDLPYGSGTMPVTVSPEQLEGVLESDLGLYRPPLAGAALVERALAQPLGAPPLATLAQGAKKVVVVLSCQRSSVALPPLLREIRKGSPGADITILVATGLRPGPTRGEVLAWLGKEMVGQADIVLHDPWDNSKLVSVGRLPSGAECFLNRLAVEADLLVATGVLAPHSLTGFTGGPAAIMPGIAGRKTILVSHSAPSVDSPWVQAGLWELNPLYIDMACAARLANLSFILDVVLDPKGEAIAAFAGASAAAHGEGCRFLSRMLRVEAQPADIVITSNGGYPSDRSLYQAVNGLCTAAKTVKPGGTIIMAASCRDGVGSEVFYRVLAEGQGVQSLLERLRHIPPEQTIMDQWQIQLLLKILQEKEVIMVTAGLSPSLLAAVFLQHAPTLAAALDVAVKRHGEGARVTVVPDATRVIIG